MTIEVAIWVDKQRRSGGQQRLSAALSSYLRPQQKLCRTGIEDRLISSGVLRRVKECGS